MKRVIRTSIAVVGLAGSLSILGIAAAIAAAAPAPITRVVLPPEVIALPSNAISCDDLAFGYYAPLDTDPLPEDAATVDGCVLDRSMRHPNPRVWKPP